MCALDAKLADQNGAERSFELAISHKQLLCEAPRSITALVSAHIMQNGAERNFA